LPGDYRPDGDELERARITSAGGPVITVELRLVDDSGDDVAPGAVGEILVRGPRVMAGYWRKPEATRAAIPDGWYHTGDLGRRDAGGHLFIVGRKKDMIITGGENVYPIEVENVLALHPAVLEVAVFGIPSERWGEEVRAAIVLRDGQRPADDELVAFCHERIGGYKIPKSFEFWTEPLPKTGPGKVAKNLLREPHSQCAQ
jgi:long-chain acyl-CoA synthetase